MKTEQKQEIQATGNNIKLSKLCGNMLVLKQNEAFVDVQLKETKKNILELFDKLHISDYVVKTKDGLKETNFNFKKVNVTSVDYNVDLFKKKLGKKKAKKYIDKTVEITDLETFQEIMKRFNVPFLEVKPLLKISEKVSTKKIQEDFNRGDFDINDIAGTFKTKRSEQLRITEVK